MSDYWKTQGADYGWQPTRIRNRRPWELVLAGAIIFGLAAVFAALTRALYDYGWGGASFPLASVSVVLSAVSGGWWLADRHRNNEASPGRIVTVVATLVLTPLLVLLLMMPIGTRSTLVALDAKTGRELWRVHPEAFFLGSPTVDADAVSVIGVTFKTGCGGQQFRFTFSRLTGRQQSRRSGGFAPYPNLPSSPGLGGPAAAGFRLDRSGEALARLDAQGRQLWSAPIPIVSERSIVTTMIAQDVVYVAADGERRHNCPSD